MIIKNLHLEYSEFSSFSHSLAIIQCHQQQKREEESKSRQKVPQVVSVKEPEDDTVLVPIPGDSRRVQPVRDCPGVVEHAGQPEDKSQDKVEGQPPVICIV